MKEFRNSAALFALILFLGACSQGESSDDGNSEEQSEEQSEEGADEKEEESAPIPVEVATPIRGDIYAVYSGTAPIEAFAEADVVAKVEGEIRRLNVEEGDMVNKGQVLASLDGDRLRLELSESEARLRKMQRDFHRNKELQEKDLISEGDFERIQYDMEALEASFNLASLELDYTRIRAPIGGVISERYVKLGNTIRVGDPVYRVTSLDPLVAYLYVPEREFRQLKAGQPARIDVDAIGGDGVFAVVTRVSPIVDSVTGTFKITIEISGEDHAIKPGMFGRINIIYDSHANVLQVPRGAIQERGDVSWIFVVEDEVAMRKEIKTGFSSDGMVEVTEGLVDGEQVIVIGQIGLKDEAKVVVINADDEREDSE